MHKGFRVQFEVSFSILGRILRLCFVWSCSSGRLAVSGYKGLEVANGKFRTLAICLWLKVRVVSSVFCKQNMAFQKV